MRKRTDYNIKQYAAHNTVKTLSSENIITCITDRTRDLIDGKPTKWNYNIFLAYLEPK